MKIYLTPIIEEKGKFKQQIVFDGKEYYQFDGKNEKEIETKKEKFWQDIKKSTFFEKLEL